MSTKKQQRRHEEWLNERLMRSVSTDIMDDVYSFGFARIVDDGLIITYRDDRSNSKIPVERGFQ